MIITFLFLNTQDHSERISIIQKVINLCINGKVRIFKFLNNENEDRYIGLVMALSPHELVGDGMFCSL